MEATAAMQAAWTSSQVRLFSALSLVTDARNPRSSPTPGELGRRTGVPSVCGDGEGAERGVELRRVELRACRLPMLRRELQVPFPRPVGQDT